MDYFDFRNKYQGNPIILSKELAVSEKDYQNVHNQLTRWLRKGLVIKLKKGIYVFNEHDRRVNPDRMFLANHLYEPSYVSLEFALNYYGLIPERTREVTSVSTKKTARFSNALGEFTYRHVQPEAFQGFRSLKYDSGYGVFLADPEKAVVDFLYFHLPYFRTSGPAVFKESYRFQNVGDLRPKRIQHLAGLFDNLQLSQAARAFCEWMKHEDEP